MINLPRITTLSASRHLRVAAMALIGCAVVVALRAAEDGSFTPVLIKGHPAHPTRLLAKVKPVAHASAHASALAAQGLRTVRGFDLVPGLVVLDADPQIQAMAAASTGRSHAEIQAVQLQTRIDALRASGLFEFVEPDWVVNTDAAPTDSAYENGTLWGLNNVGQQGGVAGIDIDAQRAWDFSTGTSDVIVAVIDSGIRATHVDLAAQMWRNPGEVAGNGIDDDHNGYVDDVVGINAVNGSGDPADAEGHGTHVAGTIGAAANNGYGHVGVAWQVRLMACKFLGEDVGGLTSGAIECIEYAVAHGARILNCSWGGRGFSRSLQAAIAAAGRKGALVVAAAGNSSADNDRLPHYPAAFDVDNIVAVAAIDRSGNLARFSNYGPRSVDLGAPGVDIYSTFSESDSGYLVASGTSMAAPHVAGVAALVRARFPGIAMADLRDRLINTTTNTDSLLGITVSGGRISAYGALATGEGGALRVFVRPRTGSTLVHGRTIPLVARVVDLVGVRGATVVAALDGGTAFTLRDDGVAPDLVAGDSDYTGSLTAPAAGELATLRVTATAPGKVAGVAEVVYALRAPPINDDFANRSTLPSTTSVNHGSNVGATAEVADPLIAGHRGGASVWWTWTASADASVTLSTMGSDFDTMLGVYTGTSLDQLVEVAGNDNYPGLGGVSVVTFAAIAGEAYQIAIDGWDGATGTIVLGVTADIPPPNDLFAKRITLLGASGSITGTASNSTMEPGEPEHLRDPQVARSSVWWTWTAPATDTAVFRVTSQQQQQPHAVVVYQGSEFADLRRLPVRAVEGTTSIDISATVAVTAGETYAVAVATAYEKPIGDFTLNWEMAARPPNDHFVDRIAIVGSNAQVAGTTLAATQEIGEPQHTFLGDSASVWWSWVAPGTGTATFVVPEGDLVAGMAVYTGSSVASLTPMGRSLPVDYNSVPRRVSFPTISGATYAIAVDGGYGTKGAFSLQLSWGLAPVNDLFANAAPVTGTAVALAGDNTGASRENGESLLNFGSGNTIWWNWTAPWTGTAWVQSKQVREQGFHVVDVFTGESPDSLQRVWDAARSPLSTEKAFLAVAGTTYHIAADGFANYVGPVAIDLSLHARPPNDDFANRVTIAGSQVDVRTSHAYATLEPDEFGQISAGPVGSVWWTWTAPATGTATIRVAGPVSLTSLLAVFTGSELIGLDPIALASEPHRSFDAVAGTTYQIRIAATTVPGSPFTLYLHQGTPPSNDNFADRIAISGAAAQVTANIRGATVESDEWYRRSLSSDASVWWTWTAPTTGRALLSAAGSSFRALIDVYSGAIPGQTSAIADNRPDLSVFDPAPYVLFDAVAGGIYQIAVDGFRGEVGDLKLQVGYVTPPANDDFANRATITGASTSLAGSNFGASRESLDSSNANASVWWTWTAPASGLTAILTGGSSFDTRLLVFEGTDPTNLRTIGYNDDRSVGDSSSLVIFTATGGAVYQIAVYDANGAMGDIALRLLMGGPPSVPNVALSPATVSAGAAYELSVDLDDTAGLSLQWLHDGIVVVGATGPTLTIPCVQTFDAGGYSLRISNVFGTAVTTALTVIVAEPPLSDARLTNLSTRALVLTGDDVLIPGFVIAGPGSKQLLIRAVGPTLGTLGVAGTLPDPRLTLKRWNGASYDDVATNDDWGTNPNAAAIIAKAAELFAFSLNTGSADAALLLDLEPGQYSAIAGDAGTGAGIAIVELYDADLDGGTARLINISNRGYVGTGDSIMIPGYVVSSEGPKTLLIRAVGPTLSAFGVSGVLSNPTLSIYRRVQGTEELILTNDDWSIGPGAQRTRDVAAQVQAFALPDGSKDAAFVVTLNPGTYTVHARGANDTTGVALVEVYAVP